MGRCRKDSCPNRSVKRARSEPAPPLTASVPGNITRFLLSITLAPHSSRICWSHYKTPVQESLSEHRTSPKEISDKKAALRERTDKRGSSPCPSGISRCPLQAGSAVHFPNCGVSPPLIPVNSTVNRVGTCRTLACGDKKTAEGLYPSAVSLYFIELHTFGSASAAFALGILLERRNSFFTIFQEA